ncbi:MAG: class I SAM-dependent methyltransferase [Actinomycetota bacterium]
MSEVEKKFCRSAVWRELVRRTVMPWILGFSDLPSRADVLEVGSGMGHAAEMFLDRFPGWNLVATDHDEEMVEQLRARLERFDERARVERADATALAYPDRTFDLVVSLGVWHHIGSWETALAECARVLRPGGRLLLVDLLPGFFVGPIAKVFPPERTYSLGELREQLAEAGFARFRVRAAGRLWYRLLAETPYA